MSSNGQSNVAKPPLSKSPFQIEILNAEDNETVYQRFLLIQGRAGNREVAFESLLKVTCNDFPKTEWPCVDSYFKCLLHLIPGPNTICFTMDQAQLNFHVNYLPLLQNPPLSLAIFIGSDSPGVFDVPIEKRKQNTLDIAVEKLRMAGYIWQAFCGEQLYRNGMGRRTFRLDEGWLPDTVSQQDKGVMRNTAKVHIIRSKHTMKEIRDVRRAQQSKDRDDSIPDLFSFVLEGLNHTPPFNEPCHVAALIIDSHWDVSKQVVLAHAALGGGSGSTRLGIFGSHLLHAWPTSIEDIVPSMMNDTVTDTRYLSNDANESGTWWKALNIGMGAMLHEVGHSYTLPHSGSGIMSRGYNNFNRTFMPKEPGFQPIPAEDEKGSHWHRTDIVKLRFHPGFRIPQDGPLKVNSVAPSFIPLKDKKLMIVAPAGLSMVEMFVNGRYKTHIEFIQVQKTEMTLSLNEITERCGCQSNEKIGIQVDCINQEYKEIKDIHEFFNSREVRLPGIDVPIIKSDVYGNSGLGSKEKSQSIFYKNNCFKKLRTIIVYYGDYLDGFTLCWLDGTEDTIGKTNGKKAEIDVRPGDAIQGFHVKAGAWVDGIQFIFTSGRLSHWFGGKGGSTFTVSAPEGYALVGIFATAGRWMDSIGIYYQTKDSFILIKS